MILAQTSEAILQAAKAIVRGGVIAFRTDTLYGLGADPFNRAAVRRIKELKGRVEDKPILVVISEVSEVARFISKPSAEFEMFAAKFWPGPLTLIGKATSGVPDELTAGTKTVGVRLPDDENARALVRACGGALTATSANPADAEAALNAQVVNEYFGAQLDLIIDDGSAKTDKPSTVVDVSGNEAVLIREGVITWSEIQQTLD